MSEFKITDIEKAIESCQIALEKQFYLLTQFKKDLESDIHQDKVNVIMAIWTLDHYLGSGQYQKDIGYHFIDSKQESKTIN